jgi:hypothetical protein
MLAASYYKTAQYASAERAFTVLKEKCPDEEIRARASAGLNASMERLHNLRTEETGERPAAPKDFSDYIAAANNSATGGASGPGADETGKKFLNWLEQSES